MSKKPEVQILVTEPMAEEGLFILNNQPHLKVDVCLGLNKNELVNKIAPYDALLVRSQTTVDRNLLLQAKNLKFIGRAGVGLDNIDVKTAKEQNINVVNTPKGNSLATAELSFGLMLSLARKIPQANKHLLEGKWQRSQFTGIELAQKTLGLIGFGNVARLVCKRAQAFDMQVIAYDPFIEKDIFSEYGVKKISLDELFSQADFISLHSILNSDTKHIISRAAFTKMKPSVKIINTARGELIDNEALLEALNNNQVSAAALDVYAIEPPASSDPLINHAKVIATPHLGASTEEAQKRVSVLLSEETIGFFSKA